MDIRDKLIEYEEQTLSRYACFPTRSRGRARPEPPCPVRTDFQRDKDRIIHSKAFRRLKSKTQCFMTGEGDHFRTRMTHTLEVSQIARTIARALFLNEDLTEAISLGHDLGHAPFGHAGERALDRLNPGGFAHNSQGVRVVEYLENRPLGLNLTYEVRDGILCHTGRQLPSTLEGQILRYADKIAYINHDIDDSLRAGILSPEEIDEKYYDALGRTSRERINALVTDIIYRSEGMPRITMSPQLESLMMELRAFLFERVYRTGAALEEERKASDMLGFLFDHYLRFPEALPDGVRTEAETAGVEQAVTDYIAGMTDRFCIDEFCRLFIPSGS